jgi:hypothetical protein
VDGLASHAAAAPATATASARSPAVERLEAGVIAAVP